MSTSDGRYARKRRLLAARAGTVAALVSFAAVSCHPAGNPGPGSPQYAQIVSAFYSGVAALDAGDVEHAPSKLALAAKLAPEEPAAWANLALSDLRSSEIDKAEADLKKAQDLAPDNGEIIALAADIAVDKGDFAGGIGLFNKAIVKDPSDLKMRYALYQAIQQEGGVDADQQGEEQLKEMLKLQPTNIALLLELARVAAKNGEQDLVKQLLTEAAKASKVWPEDTQAQLKTAMQAAGSNARESVPQVMMLRNELSGFDGYQDALSELEVPEGTIADPISRFIVLQNPTDKPAPPDTSLTFTEQPLSITGQWNVVKSAWLSGDGSPATLVANDQELLVTSPSTTQSLPFPGNKAPPTFNSILPVDLDDDGFVDLVLAGAGGLKIYHQSAGKFVDVTAAAKLPAAIMSGKYTGAWPANLYTGGAIDIVLGTASGAPIALRNNDNGTFTAIHPFPGVSGVSAFCWVDLDGDGVGDAALVDGAGNLHLFRNARAGNFEEWPDAAIGRVVAISSADVDRGGRFSQVAWCADGSIKSISMGPGGSWEVKPLLMTTSGAPQNMMAAAPPENQNDGNTQLIWADLDNNGALDLIATGNFGALVLLGDDAGHFVKGPQFVSEAVSVADDGVSGRLDLIGLSGTHAPALYKNAGTKTYHWQQIRLQAISQGDGKNNSFGVGGQIALRAGLLFEDQPVTGPVTHFGLGTNPKADFARIQWPNGLPQAEFELGQDQLAQVPERLKGSCPWLFAWNGSSMAFVTDFLWRSALGLRIDAQMTSGGGMTGDWNKIDGAQLVPRDGCYDLSLTTQLWESYFFDQIKLMTVDHPAGTEMWVDERFCIPPPALGYHITTPARPIVRAVDDLGNDVTGILSARDGRYLDTFGRGRYQGLTRDHFVQVDIGKATSGPGRQWLLAEGWIHPTDSSINMQLSLGDHPKPTGLSLEVPDGHGGWRVARTGLGFPEGKNKTILIDLTGLFASGQERVVRLCTNLELYWDWMATATEVSGANATTRVIDPTVANLRYHGFNATSQASPSSPEVPDYANLSAVGQQWRDMEGFYTRFGDVRPLLKAVDDRYVIMNAGDEIALRFPAAAPPAPGMVRDYVLIGDGWGKDCDINSGYSQTVLPLPSHADLKYDHAAGRLVDDPVYKAHTQDWVDYQTRYVSPRGFQTVLR